MARPYHRFQRGAGGSRTHFKLLCRQPPCRLAPAPCCQCPRQESNLSLDLRRVVCKIHHTPRTFDYSAPRRGIEPRPAVSKTAVRSGTLTRHFLVHFVGRNQNVSTMNRTWISTFGRSYAIHYTIETHVKSRRLDSHQHCAVYKTAAFLNRATSAFFSTSARSRTSCDGFGDRLLSQEHARVSVPGHKDRGLSTYSLRSA